MATPASLRSQVAKLADFAERDLRTLWRQVSTAAEASVALNDILPALIQTYGEAAAYVASEWYDDAREKAGVGGSFRGFPTELPDPGAPGLVSWAAREATSLDTMLPLVLGGVQKRIANASRYTVADSTVADPRTVGWQRTGLGACKFCQMLIGRGHVYTEATVDFGAHDNCRCQAAPAFKGEPKPVQPYKVSPRREVDPDTGKLIPDADFERAKTWIDDNLSAGATPRRRAPAAPRTPTPALGAASMTREQIELQISITEGLKSSEWRTRQLARLRTMLAAR